MSDHEHEEESHGGGHGGGHHGPHAGGGHEEAHEGAPEWLISFADNVALMMGFFVILLAMKMSLKSAEPPAATAGASSEDSGEGAPSAALLDMAIAIREAFHNPVDVQSNNPRDRELIQRILGREKDGQAVSPGQEGNERDVRSLRPSDYVAFGGKLSFEQGEETLSAAARTDVAELAARLKGRRSVIEVRGHASAAEAYQSADHGMALSYQRALAAADALVREGVGWERLRIVACADNDRISQIAYDARGHQSNQRVEVIETDRSTLGDEPAGGPSPASGPSVPASTPADAHATPVENKPDHGGGH
ncbi:flagellar motor protein MotB [Phycisphaerae bacterium RAS1]|nr:flagellar motor protein MotB [Phycisphaerae bacterium RAS1]